MNTKNKDFNFKRKILDEEKNKLVDEEEYMRRKQKQLASYNSVMRTLTFLKDEMDTVILRDDLTVDQKLQLFQAAQQRFDNVRSSQGDTQIPSENAQVVVTTPKSVEAPATNSTADAGIVSNSKEDESKSESEEQREIGELARGLKINKRYHKKLGHLVNHLSNRPDVFGVANTNELVLHGKVVNGSNMSDLMHNLYHSNKSHNLIGNAEFMKALASTNTPPSFIVNSRARSSMTFSPQKGEGFVRAKFPPGKRPHILRVY